MTLSSEKSIEQIITEHLLLDNYCSGSGIASDSILPLKELLNRVISERELGKALFPRLGSLSSCMTTPKTGSHGDPARVAVVRFLKAFPTKRCISLGRGLGGGLPTEGLEPGTDS